MRRRSFLFAAAGAFAARAAEASLGVIAYIQKDGLWTRTLPVGQTQRLVDGANLEAPRFSPSGKWISYLRDGAVQVVPSDGGQPIALGKASQAQWFPARDELLLDSPSDVKLVSTRSIPGASLPVVFSPNGDEIVYGRRSSLVLDQPGAAPRVLVSKDGSGLLPAAWIGNSILYWEDPDFSASVMADGLELFRIPAAGGASQSMGVPTLVHEDTLAPSPGGKLLAIGAGAGRFAWAGKRIATVDPNTAAVSYLTDPSVAAVFPSWSPDGDRIAYCAAPSPPYSASIGGGDAAKHRLALRRIFVAGASGTGAPRRLTNDSRYRDERPIWSSDGRHILFCRIDGAGNRTLWLMEVDTSVPTQVAGPLQAEDEAEAWFGYYGYINWRAMVDWYRK